MNSDAPSPSSLHVSAAGRRGFSWMDSLSLTSLPVFSLQRFFPPSLHQAGRLPLERNETSAAVILAREAAEKYLAAAAVLLLGVCVPGSSASKPFVS